MASDTQVAIEAGDTLENLVNQFTDPYACLRELIQNSMDAGSASIDIWFEFKPSEKDQGIMIIHIDDTGEGMTRRVIDTKLTQLFSSSKENDLTKVGKFGIGFVSVFALEPNAVIVDTGKDGEYWRLIFREDRKFDRIILPSPVEGTQIQIVKVSNEADFEKAKKRSVDTITYWCKHVESEITVEGQRMNQEFRMNHPYEFVHKGQDTEIVVCPSDAPEPFFGFYNRGLTLREGEKEYLPGVAFKVSSRYLEHTLTRDNVLTDKNYDKAMALLSEIVNGPFRKQLFDRAAAGTDYRLMGYLAPRFGRKLPSEYENMPLVPTVDGGRTSIRALRKAMKKYKMFLYGSTSGVLTKRVQEELGCPVILWKGPEEEPGLERLLAKLGEGRPALPVDQVWAAPEILEKLPEHKQRLLTETTRLMRHLKSPYRGIVPADFGRHSPALADKLYLEQVQQNELVYVADPEEKPRNWKNFLLGFARGKVLLVNVTHPLIEPHFQLYQQRPVLAAYMMTKAITIDDGLDAETESKLLEAALEMEA